MWKLEQLVQHEHLNSWDEEFVFLVYKDIDGFLNETSDRCVLIFPPLNNRRRYFVHKVGELFNVQTFSVGEGVRRLTVVCASEKIEKQVDEEKKVMDKIDSKKGAISKAKRSTRPDAPIYIPPAIRRVQKTQLPEKNDKTHQSSKSNRQKDNKKQENNVAETCNILTKKSEIDVNIIPNSSDLNISQLVNDTQEVKIEDITPVQNVNMSESAVPERNVINLTSDENEISPLINNIETQSDVSNQIVPLNSQNLISQENSEIIMQSQESCIKNIPENIDNISQESNDQKVVHINIETEQKNLDDNSAVNIIEEYKRCETKSNSNFNKDDDQKQEELLRVSEEINRSNKRIINHNIETEIINLDDNSAVNIIDENKKLDTKNNSNKDDNQEQKELLHASEEINRRNKKVSKHNIETETINLDDNSAVNIIMKNKKIKTKNDSNKDDQEQEELLRASEEINRRNKKMIKHNLETEKINLDDNLAINIIEENKKWKTKNNSNKDNDQDQEELLRASEEINRRNKRIIKQSFNNSNILIIDKKSNGNDVCDKSKSNSNINQEKEAPVDCWEDLLEGGKLDSDLMLEIIDQVGNVNISTAKEDYSDFKQKISLEGDYAHVLEIYDFPKEFQTRDLVSVIDSFKNGTSTYHIKWVDDNHALGVFTSGFVATEMLKTSHPLIKLRPMSEASKQSISKAIRYPNAMMPSAVRPQTCPQTARRMVTGALGLKLINAKEERAKEIKILKEAREKKRLSARQQDDAWEGKTSSN